jgi:outer membrane protein insertion porin family
MRRPAWWAVALAGAFAVAAAVPSRAVAQDTLRVIRSLKFTGNKSIDKTALSAAIGTTNSSWFARNVMVRWIGLGEKRYLDETELRRDVLRIILLYRQSGFLEVKVDTAVARDPKYAWITFKITEGPPVVVTSFTVNGIDTLPDPAKLTQDLPLRLGKPFNRFLFQASADSILRRLRDLGYPSADVLRNFTVDKVARTAVVSLDVLPGRFAVFGGVTVVGSGQVDSTLIREMLVAKPGDPYAQGDLEESQHTLARTELFRFASVTLDSATFQFNDSVAPILVRVGEGHRYKANGGVGYATEDCFRVSAGWTDRNAFGTAHQFQIAARLSKIGVGEPLNWGLENSICSALKQDSIGSRLLNYSVTASMRQPKFVAPRTEATYSIFASRTSEFQIYMREEIGAAFQVLWLPKPSLPVSFRYRASFGRTFATAATYCAFFFACTAQDTAQLAQGQLGATLTGLARSTRTNSLVDPTRGRSIAGEVTWSSPIIGSSTLQRFLRLVGDASWYRLIAPSVVLSWHLRGGVLLSPPATVGTGGNNFIPPEYRFYAGGPNDVRGYDVNGLGPLVYLVQADTATPGLIDSVNNGSIPVSYSPTGGNTLVIGNVELRVPSPIFPSRMRFALFLDAGMLWERGETNLSPALPRFTPGLGFRLITPIGPLRLDLGYNGYPNQPGPLYLQRPDGSIVLIQPDFTKPTGTGWKLHFAIGQAF